MVTIHEEGVSSTSASSADDREHEEVELDDGFPKGMRVMAIDSNDVCLNVLVSLLQKCKYQVTAHTMATEALEELRRNRDTYQIVITSVLGLDMDWIQLLEIISLEMDIPVVMVSASEDMNDIMRAVLHGARDYLHKPVREQELRNIWQHVVRKKTQSRLEERKDKLLMKRPAPTAGREEASDIDDENHDQAEDRATRKRRVSWSPELHHKFVDAYQRLGRNAVPKRILELMNAQGLTRENVASHLQKYRNMLRKHNIAQSQQSKFEAAQNSTNWPTVGNYSMTLNRPAIAFRPIQQLQDASLQHQLSHSYPSTRVILPEFRGFTPSRCMSSTSDQMVGNFSWNINSNINMGLTIGDSMIGTTSFNQATVNVDNVPTGSLINLVQKPPAGSEGMVSSTYHENENSWAPTSLGPSDMNNPSAEQSLQINDEDENSTEGLDKQFCTTDDDLALMILLFNNDKAPKL